MIASAVLRDAAPPHLAVYAARTTAGGITAIVRRPCITGAAGRTYFHCWTGSVPEAVVLHAEDNQALADTGQHRPEKRVDGVEIAALTSATGVVEGAVLMMKVRGTAG